MAVTVKALEELGIDGDKTEKIIEMHMETVNALKSKIETYKVDALKVPEMSKKLEELENAIKVSDEYKTKYEQETKSFSDFKRQLEAEKTNSAKKSAYQKLLEENKVKKSKWDLIMRTVKLDDLKLKEDNTLDNSEELTKGIITDWTDFVEREITEGVKVARPPAVDLEKVNKEKEQLDKFRSSLGIPEILNKK